MPWRWRFAQPQAGFSSWWGWMGAESTQPRAGRRAGCPELGQSHAAKPQRLSHAWKTGHGRPGNRVEDRQLPNDFGGPQGFSPRVFAPSSWAQAPSHTWGRLSWLSQAPWGQEGPGWGGQSLHERYPRSIPWGGGCWRDPDRAWQRREVQQPRAERAERAELLPHPLLWDSPGALRVPG